MNDKEKSEFEEKVRKTIEDFHLIEKGDKVLVACSGGKDSTTCLYLLKKFGYNVEGLTIDLLIGQWSKENLDNLKIFCDKEGIKLHTISIRDEFGYSICYIRSIIQSKHDLSNCTICGVIKRWLLNKKAREIGATKIATGHNLDDEAETVLMNISTGNVMLGLRLGPKTGILHSEKFIPRIKPMYYLTNAEIRAYSEAMNFPVLYDPCPCAVDSFRHLVRRHLKTLEAEKPGTKRQIVDTFLEMIPIVKDYYKPGKGVKICELCGEPSSKNICKTCNLIQLLRS